MISSASAGMPLRPSRALTMPSFIAPPRGERRLLAVIGDGDVEGARVLERRAHELRAGDRLAVVADGDRAGADHLAELGERLALLADRDRADRIDARRAGALRLPDDEADRGLIVGDRIGVRHRAHRGEAAGRRGARAGGDRLHVLAPGLAQVAVHVDEARGDDAARRSRSPRRRRRARRSPTGRCASTTPSREQHVADLVEPLRRIDDPAAAQQQRRAVARSRAHRSLTALGRFGELRAAAGEQIEHRHADRRRRSSPGRGSRCAARRPRRSRSRRRGSSGRGAG